MCTLLCYFNATFNSKTHTMKDKFINWFIDVTVWLAWFLIVSTALMAICLVPSFIVDVLCK